MSEVIDWVKGGVTPAVWAPVVVWVLASDERTGRLERLLRALRRPRGDGD